jgi:hypothetical protein
MSPSAQSDKRGDHILEKVVDTNAQNLVDNVRQEWKQLWQHRIDDKYKAEGMANRDFPLLFLDGGTVIIATRDFRLLDLKDILHMHEIQNVERLVPPHPSVGGWRKFSRAMLSTQKRAHIWEKPSPERNPKKNLQSKKGGRGWLHLHTKK